MAPTFKLSFSPCTMPDGAAGGLVMVGPWTTVNTATALVTLP